MILKGHMRATLALLLAGLGCPGGRGAPVSRRGSQCVPAVPEASRCFATEPPSCSPCAWTSGLPCTEAGCEFAADANGKLSRRGECPDKKVLSLGNKLIANLSSGLWYGLSEATHLSLDTNCLSVLQPFTFSGLSKLQFLDLSDNELAKLVPGIFDPLTGLRELRLQGNRLTALPVGIFDNLLLLQRLYLEDNPQLPCIPIELQRFAALTTYHGPVQLCKLCAPHADHDAAGCKCPKGFSGPDSGPCAACASGFFQAVAGSEACEECPAGSTSPNGSISARACIPTPPKTPGYLVSLTFSLPMSLAAFDESKYQFQWALASAAGASRAHVSIDRVDTVAGGAQRRLLSESVHVATSIRCAHSEKHHTHTHTHSHTFTNRDTHPHTLARTHTFNDRVWDWSKAEGLRSNPPIAELNRELALVGLPPASVVQHASMGVAGGELASERGAGEGGAPTAAAVVGVSLGALFLLCLFAGDKDG